MSPADRAPVPPRDTPSAEAVYHDPDGLTLSQRLDHEEADFLLALRLGEEGPGIMPGDIEGMFHRIRVAARLHPDVGRSESEREAGSVQVYPEGALEPVPEGGAGDQQAHPDARQIDGGRTESKKIVSHLRMFIDAIRRESHGHVDSPTSSWWMSAPFSRAAWMDAVADLEGASGSQGVEADGWETLDTCPSGGEPLWVWHASMPEPQRRVADGEWWRCNRADGGMSPTHWCHDRAPAPPTPAGEASHG